MGSKFKLLPWIHENLREIPFGTATDAFCGSGAVSYLLKAMGKSVHSNDALSFPAVLAAATIENSNDQLSPRHLKMLLDARASEPACQFIRRTFEGIFFTPADLAFLDDAWSGIRRLTSPSLRALAVAALLRSASKRQPRGLFTVAGDPEKYKDGRRDLQLTLREHFIEQVEAYNQAVFSSGMPCTASCGDVFSAPQGADLVYLDPPYVPLADDNCYMKRYHFLEGLSCYWKDKELMPGTKVKKITKPFTPFSYRHSALDAFDRLFRHFADSTLVLSYSSNAFPDLKTLRALMKRYKRSVTVAERTHRYHFGTHAAAQRNIVQEYLIIGTA